MGRSGRVLALIGMLAPVLALLLAEARVGRALERRAYDGWVTLRGSLPPPEGVVVVAIDTDSEGSLGRYPWSRTWHAHLLRNLHSAGARAVAFDLTFADAFPEDDAVFRAAVDGTGIAVLGAKTDVIFRREARGHRLEEPAGALRGAPIGIVDVARDGVDGVVREYPVLHHFPQGSHPQLGVAALLASGEANHAVREVRGGWRIRGRFVPRGPGGGMLIDFLGPPGSVSVHSYVTVVDDADTDVGEWDMDSFEDLAAGGAFRGRIVLVGTTIPEHQDLHPTPVRDSEGAAGAVLMPGVEIHAHAVAALLDGRFIRAAGRPVQYGWVVLLGLLAVLGARRLEGKRGALASLGLGFVALAASWLLFSREGIWLWSVAPLLSIGFAYAASAAVLVTEEARERARLRGMFQQYVPPAVVDELVRRPELLALGGEEREATILFSDITGFSAIAESLPPRELVALLNEYLTAMTDVVVEHGGIVDKYIGDALMAEFGVPVPREDHALQACLAALHMRRELARLRTEWERRGLPAMHARIGINTGRVLVGNLGSRRMMDYTCMGDHVNLASRLEGANAGYGTDILVSAFTWGRVGDHLVGREVDRVRVVGRSEPVAIHELVATRAEGVDGSTAHLLASFDEALGLYRERRYAEARAAFLEISERHPGDGPARVYAGRCLDFVASPPPSLWDGVHQMASK
jgi:adenylate cyclase